MKMREIAEFRRSQLALATRTADAVAFSQVSRGLLFKRVRLEWEPNMDRIVLSVPDRGYYDAISVLGELGFKR